MRFLAKEWCFAPALRAGKNNDVLITLNQARGTSLSLVLANVIPPTPIASECYLINQKRRFPLPECNMLPVLAESTRYYYFSKGSYFFLYRNGLIVIITINTSLLWKDCSYRLLGCDWGFVDICNYYDGILL